MRPPTIPWARQVPATPQKSPEAAEDKRMRSDSISYSIGTALTILLYHADPSEQTQK